ncbi:MAG: group III truncated hemoglobin [Rubellimicrobium sp.]|nr:group III truncated hemoglobin [Rubellimicrobium sp.]
MTASPRPVPASLRPAMTAELMEATGLDGEMLSRLVHGFYDRVRRDDLLGPIFAERIADWGPHLEKMVAFWHSVALMTGTYKGAPMPAHVTLPVEWHHYQRWLSLFRTTAEEICPPEGAAHVIERAERIARSLFMATEDHRRMQDAAPVLAPHN